MQLQYIYKSDINRDINGVIKVAQNDERSMKQELEEYIITRELRRHFNTFLNNYERSLGTPTDKIGPLPENALLSAFEQRGCRKTRGGLFCG